MRQELLAAPAIKIRFRSSSPATASLEQTEALEDLRSISKSKEDCWNSRAGGTPALNEHSITAALLKFRWLEPSFLLLELLLWLQEPLQPPLLELQLQERREFLQQQQEFLPLELQARLL